VARDPAADAAEFESFKQTLVYVGWYREQKDRRMREGLNRLAAVLMTAAGVLFAAPTAAGPGWIDIHTEAWQDYTQRDGTGFAWDVIRAVY
jgi:hypothetical protein